MSQIEHKDYSKLEPITAEIRRRVSRADKNDTIPSSVAVAEASPGVVLEAVDRDSIGAELDIEPGWKIISINENPIRDTIDYYFHGAEHELDLLMESPSGEKVLFEIEKSSPEEALGFHLQQFTTQQCGCNCVFCFVHQLPDSMRKSLYIKDEDYRLSFMQGSYVTGITLKDSDLERIANQRLTPLFISVHAVDEELRKWLLGVKKCRPILELLEFFNKNRIQVHTQIVLCPEHNDGAQLEKTLDALLGYFPTVQSVAIVPLGMTKWREGLPSLPLVTPAYARKFIRTLTPRLRKITEEHGEPIVMLADEWYLIAGRKAPSYSQFPEVPQLENGVGMVYHFYRDFKEAKSVLKANTLDKKWRVAAITSTLSSPVLERINDACAEANIEVTPLVTVNRMFGDTIHVTGLLTGTDIQKAILENPGYDQYLLPGNCLRRYDTKFLDDMTLEELRKKTGANITPVLGGSLDYAETILESASDYKHAEVKNHPFLESHWSNS